MTNKLARAAGSILEIERKFCGLTVPNLTRTAGDPPFQSLRYLGCNVFTDTYFDHHGKLSSQGIWVRRRRERWEAKVRQGGDFTNSRFEELLDVADIGRCVHQVTGLQSSHDGDFGLTLIAKLQTSRKSWIADGEFKIVLDRMDFGHEVGEVELECKISSGQDSPLHMDTYKQQIAKEMDERIEKFMERYLWAFKRGTPKGKLTAYFEVHRPMLHG